MNNFYLAESQSLVGRLEEIASFLRAGKKINAIKVYREVTDRERTGLGLSDAKVVVDRIELMMRASGF